MPRSSCIRAARRLVAIVCVGGGRWRAGAEVATAAVAAASAATVVDLGVVVSDDCERGRPGPLGAVCRRSSPGWWVSGRMGFLTLSRMSES